MGLNKKSSPKRGCSTCRINLFRHPWFWGVLFFLVTAVGGFLLLDDSEEKSSRKSLGPLQLFRVEVTDLKECSLTQWLFSQGFIRSRRAVGLNFSVPGVVASLGTGPGGSPLGEGDSVRGPSEANSRGQLLAALDAEKYATMLGERRGDLAQIRAMVEEVRAEIAAGQADVDFYKSRLRRMEQLHRERVVSTEALEEARQNCTKVQSHATLLGARLKRLALEEHNARLRITRDKLDLEKTELRAPFDGIIYTCNVQRGSLVEGTENFTPQGAAFFIVDPATLEVETELSLLRKSSLSVGQSGDILSSGAARVPMELRAFSPVVTEGPQSVRAFFRIFSHNHESFYVGERVKVRIALVKKDKTLALPGEALFQEGKSFFCYILDSSRAKVHLRQVRTGIREDGWVEILQGLALGESVVVRGKETLYEGAPVKVVSLWKPSPAKREAP